MTTPDLAAAQKYALARLGELSPSLYYHSLEHTRDDVVPAAERLTLLEGVVGEERLLLITAAWFHDLGFLERRNEHEMVSVEIAASILPDMGYTPAQIEAISGMIMATRLPQSPTNLYEQMLADADLDNLGRDDFFNRNQALRDELAAIGQTFDELDWYNRQLEFVQNHHYFTAAAHQLRDEHKAKNISMLLELLAQMQGI
jgi:uncharacterized protein